MDCNSKDDSKYSKITYVHLEDTTEEDDVELPPPNLKFKFKSVKDWLSHVCAVENPKLPINTYSFGIFVSPQEYIVFLTGINMRSDGDKMVSESVFSPADMHFRLPDDAIKNLTKQQIFEKVKTEIKDFTKTEKFKTSFFARAKLIRTEFDGAEIWSK